jgi:hypothetical protein
MARCGRCGLWQQYPVDSKEKMYSGVCLWYQTRLLNQEVYKRRECPDFFERIPNYNPGWHFEYKVRRVELRTAHKEARHGTLIAYAALLISLLVGIADLFL